jgi:hypothetical protein
MDQAAEGCGSGGDVRSFDFNKVSQIFYDHGMRPRQKEVAMSYLEIDARRSGVVFLIEFNNGNSHKS